MHRFRALPLLVSSLLCLSFVRGSSAREAAKRANSAASAFTGRMVVNGDFFGTPIYFGLLMDQQGEKLTGNFDGDKLEGSVPGGRIHFLAKDEHGGTKETPR